MRSYRSMPISMLNKISGSETKYQNRVGSALHIFSARYSWNPRCVASATFCHPTGVLKSLAMAAPVHPIFLSS